MKKILFLFISLLCITYPSMGQDAEVDLYDLQSNFQDSVYQFIENNKLKEAEKLALETITLFSGFTSEEYPDYDDEELQDFQVANYYDLACIYSLMNKKSKALDALDTALELGYSNYYHFLEDSDLDNLRKEKRFAKIQDELKERGDYLYILKKDHAYLEDENAGEEFIYEGVGNWRIRNVREYLKLDSVAGDGDEISKILNIMTYIHNEIPHDGGHWPNCEIDAVDIYNYSKANNKRGVNCRALAIVLNECYLSMGFPSRFVTCLPKAKNDPDCHVINSVWVAGLNKWIWIDPSFNAYVTDENGTLLSIEEVRNRMINDEPLFLNEDANRNGRPTYKPWYLETYMAKNLYWFQCPLRNIFNVETRYRNTNEKYVSLVPTGYSPTNYGTEVIKTNNPDYFWKAPLIPED